MEVGGRNDVMTSVAESAISDQSPKGVLPDSQNTNKSRILKGLMNEALLINTFLVRWATRPKVRSLKPDRGR